MRNARRWFFILVLGYLIAFGYNLMDAIKFPDAQLTILNLWVSCFFLTLLIIGVRKSLRPKTGVFFIRASGLAMLASMLIFILERLGSVGSQLVVIDLLTNLQYPLFLAFIVPIFGFNYFLQFSYETFSAMGAIIYMIPLLASLLKREQS
jgi:hypothetical protein